MTLLKTGDYQDCHKLNILAQGKLFQEHTHGFQNFGGLIFHLKRFTFKDVGVPLIYSIYIKIIYSISLIIHQQYQVKQHQSFYKLEVINNRT